MLRCKATARICAELNNEEAEIFADGYNAAMQSFGNSEQLNSPVTPDGWISCSERMPDSKTGVLVAREFGRKGDWRMKWEPTYQASRRAGWMDYTRCILVTNPLDATARATAALVQNKKYESVICNQHFLGL